MPTQTREDEQEHSLWFLGLSDLRFTFHSFSAHSRVVGSQWAYPNHDHPMFELNLVLEGRQTVTLEGTDYQMGAGDLLLMKPGEKHSSRTDGGQEMAYCCIHFGLDDPMIRQALFGIRDTLHPAGSPLTLAVGPVLQRIRQTGSDRGGYGKENRLDMMIISFELLTELCRLLRKPPEGLMGEPQGPKGLAFRIARSIEQAVTDRPAMDDNEFGRQGIARIADELGYSSAYCNRVFKSVYGMSPRHFLSSIKLRKAKLLLLDKQMPVERIAEKLGYKDVSQFSKQFKRWMNISPSQYRQMTE